MAFPEGFIAAIKDRVSVSDVVGRRVKLVRRGREYVGLSPFKSERTPSFTVNDDKQFYHCFSSGKHGSVFDFLMETEGLSFPEAVERLAGEAGLPMPERDPRAAKRAAQQNALLDPVAQAARWFQAQLAGEAGQAARDYLEGRGVDAALASAFGIGFAPDARGALCSYLQGQGVSATHMQAAGLTSKPDDGGAPYDRFRNRIIFPIHDRRGRVIAFGGRAMSDNMRAKYLNSPQTPLFHKGEILYNFAKARTPAFDAKSVLVVEGYMDVVGLARGGFAHVVAPLGTALTEQQIALLWQLAPEPILCLDGDSAGLKAAYNAIDRALPLLKPGYSLRFALLPDGKDPDDMVQQGGADAMAALLERASNLIELLWDRELEAAPYDTPERFAALRGRLRSALLRIEHRELRELYFATIKEKLDKLSDPLPRRQNGAPARGFRPRPGPHATTKRSALGRNMADMSNEQIWLLYFPLQMPALLERHYELLERISFPAKTPEALRLGLVDVCLAASELDAASLREQLVARGLAAQLAALENTQEFRALQAASDIESTKWVAVATAYAAMAGLTKELATLEKSLATPDIEDKDTKLRRHQQIAQEITEHKQVIAAR